MRRVAARDDLAGLLASCESKSEEVDLEGDVKRDEESWAEVEIPSLPSIFAIKCFIEMYNGSKSFNDRIGLSIDCTSETLRGFASTIPEGEARKVILIKSASYCGLKHLSHAYPVVITRDAIYSFYTDRYSFFDRSFPKELELKSFDKKTLSNPLSRETEGCLALSYYCLKNLSATDLVAAYDERVPFVPKKLRKYSESSSYLEVQGVDNDEVKISKADPRMTLGSYRLKYGRYYALRAAELDDFSLEGVDYVLDADGYILFALQEFVRLNPGCEINAERVRGNNRLAMKADKLYSEMVLAESRATSSVSKGFSQF